MTFALTRKRSLCAALEAAFSTSIIATFADAFRIPAEKISFEADQEFIKREAQNDQLVQQSGIIGGKGGKIGFETDIPGLSTAAAHTVAAIPYPWMSALLKSAGLTEALSTGTTITTGASTTSLPCTLATTIAVGSIVGCVKPATGALETAIVTAKVANTLTVSPAFSFTPADGADVYGSATYTPADTDPGTITLVATADGYEYTFTGCKAPAPKLAMSARGRPMLVWAFEADSWTVTTTGGTMPTIPASTGGSAG